MYSNEFEKAFDDFLDDKEYDEASAWLFHMIRMAFAAGWEAAGGDPPTTHKIFELLPKK